MATTDNAELAAIAAEIRRFIEMRSVDFDHIVEWWFKRQWYEKTRREVLRALEYLVDHGEVTKRVLPGGRIMYVARRQSKGEAQDRN